MIDYTSGQDGGFRLTTQAPQAQAVQMPGLSPLASPGALGGDQFAALFQHLAERRLLKERQERTSREAEERRRQEAHDLQMQTAGDANARAAEQSAFGMDQARDAQRIAGEQRQLANTKPSDLGRWQMNSTGNWGTFVDPANIPASLQGTIMGGMYGGVTNWDTTNPQITGPQQWNTGKYTKNASGAGSGGPMRFDIGPGGEGYQPPDEDERRRQQR